MKKAILTQKGYSELMGFLHSYGSDDVQNQCLIKDPSGTPSTFAAVKNGHCLVVTLNPHNTSDRTKHCCFIGEDGYTTDDVLQVGESVLLTSQKRERLDEWYADAKSSANPPIDHESDAGVAGGDDLEVLMEATKQLILQEECVESLDNDLKAAKEHLRFLREETIPALMLKAGLKVLVTEDGYKITVEDKVYASISPINEAAAYHWLRAEGHDSIVKNIVSIEFDKGENKKAMETVEALKNLGVDAIQKMSIHASTLKAFVRDQIRRGENFPMDLFNATVISTAKIVVLKK